MTAAQIVAEVRLRLFDQTPREEQDYRRAIVRACDTVLAHPQSPGGVWTEQIILEAARILQETK